MLSENKLTNLELRFTMVGGTYVEPTVPQPPDVWISKKMWCTVCEAPDVIPALKNWASNFKAKDWKHIYDAADP